MNAGYHASFGQCRLCIYPLAMRLFKEKGYNPQSPALKQTGQRPSDIPWLMGR
jgi:hypothetical protein